MKRRHSIMAVVLILIISVTNLTVRAETEKNALTERLYALSAVLMDGDSGRILVRESGTEPLLRVMVEAPEDDTCRACVEEVMAVIKAKGHAI